MMPGEREPIRAYPCHWPTGWPKSGGYKSAHFKSYGKPLSVAGGIQRVLDELRMLGVERDDVVISTNMPTRLDGMPRSDRAATGGPEVAVYWERHGKRQVMAIDLYDTVADNLGAVAASLNAMRALDRHGGATILERAFAGFTALPPPRDWRGVLGVHDGEEVTMDDVNKLYRNAAGKHHPDRGGSHERMVELNRALEAARDELG